MMPRVVTLPGAVLLGLGSIVGTGIFVSAGLAAGIAGPAVVIAMVLAAGVATCNGLSSAQLAASHPKSGGTYEYGYRYLTPELGFIAGVTFVGAKTASAATAALGCGGYALTAFGVTDRVARIAIGAGVALALTAIVAGGMKRSSRLNAVIVALTIAGLAAFVVAGLPVAFERGDRHLAGALTDLDPSALLHATALLFVAYTGYGRIATLGEEVAEPERTIPRAIALTLVASLVLYVAVIAVAVGAAGAPAVAGATQRNAAPLAVIARDIAGPAIGAVVAIAAITAMLGVLLNLVLGVSRVVVAMARRGDLPRGLATLDDRGSPRYAVIATGAVIAGLALVGSVATTWSFSAFTVLVYYALTNLAALRLPAKHRRYPRPIAVVGLVACLGLAAWVELRIWLVALGLIGLALVGRALLRRHAP